MASAYIEYSPGALPGDFVVTADCRICSQRFKCAGPIFQQCLGYMLRMVCDQSDNRKHNLRDIHVSLL